MGNKAKPWTHIKHIYSLAVLLQDIATTQQRDVLECISSPHHSGCVIHSSLIMHSSISMRTQPCMSNDRKGRHCFDPTSLKYLNRETTAGKCFPGLLSLAFFCNNNFGGRKERITNSFFPASKIATAKESAREGLGTRLVNAHALFNLHCNQPRGQVLRHASTPSHSL